MKALSGCSSTGNTFLHQAFSCGILNWNPLLLVGGNDGLHWRHEQGNAWVEKYIAFCVGTMAPSAMWQALLEAFRGFGGIAENVMQREGPFGMGLFPIDPGKTVKLRVPDALLVPIDAVQLQEGAVVIKDPSAFPPGYADWFMQYQANHSWGLDGCRSIEAFEEGLKALPDAVHQDLKRLGLYNLNNRFPGENREQEIFQRFLKTRFINRKGNKVLMPVIELVNHAPAAKGFNQGGDGIAVGGVHADEILVNYSVSDPLHRLLGYGFNCQEPSGFSLNLCLQHNGQQVVVQGGVRRDGLTKPCTIERQDDKLVVGQPLLGLSREPGLPRTLFSRACAAVPGLRANELFDQIHQGNTMALMGLLLQLEGVGGDGAAQLRQGCLDHWIAIGNDLGTRSDLLQSA